jgi:CrcB-like protein, Camphor Resistance (CrcB)
MGLALILLLVFSGGAFGSIWRYWLSGIVAERFGEVFPVGTLVVNVIGSLLIGLFAGALSPEGRHLAPAVLECRGVWRFDDLFVVQLTDLEPAPVTKMGVSASEYHPFDRALFRLC